MLYMLNHLLSWSMVIINWMVHLSLNILLFVFIFQSSMLVLAGIGMAAIGFGGKERDSHFYSLKFEKLKQKDICSLKFLWSVKLKQKKRHLLL